MLSPLAVVRLNRNGPFLLTRDWVASVARFFLLGTFVSEPCLPPAMRTTSKQNNELESHKTK
jgi:hypothetical protein